MERDLAEEPWFPGRFASCLAGFGLGQFGDNVDSLLVRIQFARSLADEIENFIHGGAREIHVGDDNGVELLLDLVAGRRAGRLGGGLGDGFPGRWVGGEEAAAAEEGGESEPGGDQGEGSDATGITIDCKGCAMYIY